MVTEQTIKTEIPVNYNSVPNVFEIGGKILTVTGTKYYICAWKTEEYPYPLHQFTSTVENIMEIWGSGHRDLYYQKEKFPYIKLIGVPKSVYDKIESDFHRLAQQWERERPRGADVSEMAMHPSYQRIIGMGLDVVPFILEELERKPEHWFWALHSITGVNPVPPESEGKLKEMAKAWVDWGNKQGYSW